VLSPPTPARIDPDWISSLLVAWNLSFRDSSSPTQQDRYGRRSDRRQPREGIDPNDLLVFGYLGETEPILASFPSCL
jgi:hypothetical protein